MSWSDHPIYMLSQDEQGWIAHVLMPTSVAPEEVRGYPTSRAFVAALRERYPEGVVRYTEYHFQAELTRRREAMCDGRVHSLENFPYDRMSDEFLEELAQWFHGRGFDTI